MKTSAHLLPSIDELKELFSYDPETGVVTRRRRVRGGGGAGSAVGGSGKYMSVTVNGTHYLLHRVIWALHHGEPPPGMIDHRNGNPRDNRAENLRAASSAENMRNCRKSQRNTSGVKGVSWDKKKGRWAAQIAVNYRNIHLGRFKSKEEAAAAYAAGAALHHKEFSRLG